MKIYSINRTQCRNNVYRGALKEKNSNRTPSFAQPTFKGDKGAAIGIAAGIAIGAAITAATIMTGGLAGIVAAVGATGTIAGGAGAGAHLGGIAGGIIEDKLNNNNDNPPTS